MTDDELVKLGEQIGKAIGEGVNRVLREQKELHRKEIAGLTARLCNAEAWAERNDRRVERLAEKNAQLVDALLFYADPKTWQQSGDSPAGMTDAEMDHGSRASVAIANAHEEGGNLDLARRVRDLYHHGAKIGTPGTVWLVGSAAFQDLRVCFQDGGLMTRVGPEEFTLMGIPVQPFLHLPATRVILRAGENTVGAFSTDGGE